MQTNIILHIHRHKIQSGNPLAEKYPLTSHQYQCGDREWTNRHSISEFENDKFLEIRNLLNMRCLFVIFILTAYPVVLSRESTRQDDFCIYTITINRFYYLVVLFEHPTWLTQILTFDSKTREQLWNTEKTLGIYFVPL